VSAAAAHDLPLELARSYLLAVRREESVDALEADLGAIDRDRLAASLADDAARIAFWINVYNAAIQARLREDPRRFQGLARVGFFRRPAVTVGGHDLSPNDIEHGLLRGSKLSVGLGYFPRPRPDAFERIYRVRNPDPRVHFALNCGAVSCPAIAAYDAGELDEQLDLATRAYLDGTVSYDARTDTVMIPRLFRWYRGDFGGLAGIWRLLDAHDVLPPGASAGSRLRYAPYDWSLDLGAFRADDDARA
jgi:hypothetical protein